MREESGQDEQTPTSGSAFCSPRLGVALFPLVLLWTLPQTVVGLVFALVRRLQGHRLSLHCFGPFVFLVVPARGPASEAISLGLVIFARSPAILKHEFCHLLTGLWLTWLYLPAYGLEYLLVGHDRSPHERLTCRFEQRMKWGMRRLG
jgi:hypothetical protein